VIAALGLGAIILAGIDHQLAEQRAAQRTAILGDLAFGKTVGGVLHSPNGQFLCFDPADAFRGRYDAQDTGVQGAQDAIRDQLVATGRCTATNAKAGFDMTADGREQFQTPHGSIELWSSDTPGP
jgi:hypothetical protein